jgi:hypothetical protein
MARSRCIRYRLVATIVRLLGQKGTSLRVLLYELRNSHFWGAVAILDKHFPLGFFAGLDRKEFGGLDWELSCGKFIGVYNILGIEARAKHKQGSKSHKKTYLFRLFKSLNESTLHLSLLKIRIHHFQQHKYHSFRPASPLCTHYHHRKHLQTIDRIT